MPRRGLSHSPWECGVLRLPGAASDPRGSAKDHREGFDAVLEIARLGTPWRDLTRAFGRWHSVCRRARR